MGEADLRAWSPGMVGEKGFSRFLVVGMMAAPHFGREYAASLAKPWIDSTQRCIGIGEYV